MGSTFSVPQPASLRSLATLGAMLVVLRLARRYILHQPNLPYPPGPKPLPLLGNIFDLTREKEVEAYAKVAEKYGDLVFLSVLGKNILFVNSFKVATELFDKRMGWDWSFGHMRYGERWKAHRRLFHRQFQQFAAPGFWPLQAQEAHGLLRLLLRSPQNLVHHLRHNAASVIMNAAYGIRIAEGEDKYILIAEKALEGMAKAAQPGAFLVDSIPWLRYAPNWMPGTRWKHQAAEWKKSVLAMRDLPFETTCSALKTGGAAPCFVTNILRETEGKSWDTSSSDLEILKGCAGLVYAAEDESAVSALASFFLAMVIHPEMQEIARREIETVIGHECLPDFNDRDSLPHIDAIVKEVLRWNPVAPLGLPHMITDDDVYNGYFIPAGTTIIGNPWKVLHDPDTYPEPERFHPDRFLNQGISQALSPGSPLSAAFGYGRRPVLTSGLGIDENGKTIKTEAEFSSGMIRYSTAPRGE